jgi:hypothetical protein
MAEKIWSFEEESIDSDDNTGMGKVAEARTVKRRSKVDAKAREKLGRRLWMSSTVSQGIKSGWSPRPAVLVQLGLSGGNAPSR